CPAVHGNAPPLRWVHFCLFTMIQYLAHVKSRSAERRQICSAHLDRDVRAPAEGHLGERDFGATALRIMNMIFRSWRAFLRHGSRPRLREDLLRPGGKLLVHLPD